MRASHPLLRFTRRGCFVYQSDNGGDKTAGGAADGEGTAAPEKPEETPAKDLRTRLIEALKADPNATDEDLAAALEALVNKPADELTPKLRSILKVDETADETAVLDALTATVEKLGGYEASEQKAREDALAAQLDEYEVDDDAKAILREQLLADPDRTAKILAHLPKKKAPEETAAAAAPAAPTAPAAPAKPTPEKPTHDPAKATEQMSAQERADKISARAKTLVAESGGKLPLTKAYQQAEAELDAAK